MSKTALDFKTLKTLALNETVEFSKGSFSTIENLLKEIMFTDPAYAFNIEQKSARIYTLTRTLPEKLSHRAAFFSTVKKSDVKRAMKANQNVKVKAAAALGMSPRTFRRKLAEFQLTY